MHVSRVVLTGTLLLIGCGAAAAQATAEQQKLLAKRAAEADAYRQLAEAVYGLQINSRTFVKDFVTESDDIRTEVDSVVKGVRLGDPTWYDDGSCEVPAEVTVARVIETLRTAHDRHYRGDSIKASDFESMAKRIEKDIIKVIGMGAPREDLPPGLPIGAEELLGPAPVRSQPDIPDIWSAVGPRARMMARRAAELDAKRQLAERIMGLRLTSRTRVRDFAAESDVITAEMDQYLVGAQVVQTYFHDDELIAEVTVRVPTEQVITTVKKLHTRHYKGDDIKGHDIEEVVKRVVKKDFEATGMGVPPAQYLREYSAATGADLPDWAMEPIQAEGHGTDPEFATAQGRLMAARAAEVDAKRNLAERIAGLTLRSATKVHDFVTQHDHIATQVDAVVVGAVVTETAFTDDMAVVKVEIPGMAIWEVVSAELRRQQR